MNFERLPNELHFGIFGYFHAIDLFRAFYGLNEHFNQMLLQIPSQHLDFRDASRVQFADFCHRHLPLILSTVHSLHISGASATPGLADIFLAYGFTLDRFTQLRSLTLESIKLAETVPRMISQCAHLSHLVRLRMLDCLDNYRGELIQQMWDLPSLTSFTIRCQDPEDLKIKKFTSVSSSIKRLTMDSFVFSFDKLVHILKHTPQLQHLAARLICTSAAASMKIPRLCLSSLHLSYDSNSTEALIALFKKMPHLRRLKLDLNLCLSGDELKRIIVSHLPKLECFDLKMNFQVELRSKREATANRLMAMFQTPFWLIEKQWFFRCSWSSEETIDEMTLWTTSYPFDIYRVDKHRRSKSMLPANHPSQSSALRVNRLCFGHNPSTRSLPSICSFINMGYLGIVLPCRDAILALIPMLNRLSSIYLDFTNVEDAHLHLQIILDRVTRLRRLILHNFFNSDFEKTLLTIQSKPIGELYIQSMDTDFETFNRQQCVTLATSPLGQSCHSLVIKLKTFKCVPELVKRLPKLRSLQFAYYEPSNTFVPRGWKLPHLFDWLEDKVPDALWYKRKADGWVTIFGWIRWSNNENGLSTLRLFYSQTFNFTSNSL